MTQSSKGACLVVGVGIGVGGEIAKAFAAEGYRVCMTRRARNLDQLDPLLEEIRLAGGEAHAFGVDARIEDEVVALFDQIERDIGPLEVVVFNIGANVQFKVQDTSARVFHKVWEMAAFAGFLAGREAARVMLPRGKGTILFTGASSSVRGAPDLTAFTSAKFALRAVAESMAKELGPQGIHVGHIVAAGAAGRAPSPRSLRFGRTVAGRLAAPASSRQPRERRLSDFRRLRRRPGRRLLLAGLRIYQPDRRDRRLSTQHARPDSRGDPGAAGGRSSAAGARDRHGAAGGSGQASAGRRREYRRSGPCGACAERRCGGVLPRPGLRGRGGPPLDVDGSAEPAAGEPLGWLVVCLVMKKPSGLLAGGYETWVRGQDLNL